ncbi:uncharacterized protein LOC129584366 [Paramacrobiotus metropolitanus]|uniref:uncharacterized protein LOC129584366 n=1 Tax=Paramacrobiotus metropolitanus TaxID=2943436 RepID=UPI002445DD77|nr:uncharacterized protein LOC129584366 [Paramacrobiotus metropolitanus]
MIIFPYPFLKINETDHIIETKLYVLSREALPLFSAPQGSEVKLLLDMLLLSQQKLKLQLKAGGSFNLTWSLMTKTFALIASITVIANELISKDDSIQQRLQNSSSSFQ